MLERIYGISQQAIRADDMFLVRYDGDGQQHLARHRDGTIISINILLNDDFEGGETVFYPDVSIKPKKGSVLLFPPYWMFPHRGNPVIKGKKYILSTYCLWSPDEQN